MNAETFNSLHPVGTPVFAYPGARPEDIPSARRIVTRTRSKAQSVGLDREGVVWVEDHGAYIALSHVDVVPESVWAAAKEAEAVAAKKEQANLRAELDSYEVMNPQQCRAGKHADWLVDSEYAHACPWCQVEQLKAERDALQQRLNQAAMTRTWRNEDGKKFVFVEDIAPALLGIEPKSEATS